MDTSTKTGLGFRATDSGFGVGIIVDAGPGLGYGHAVRCVRLARGIESFTRVVFHPLSEACATFLRDVSPGSKIQDPTSEVGPLAPVVITDLREAHGITATIHRHGSRHISIHDLGLAQCRSDVAVDGSVARLFPYPPDKDRTLFAGPQYMITREPVARSASTDTVLITFGGGATAKLANQISDDIRGIGLRPVTTGGFTGSTTTSDQDFAQAMSTCRFAISGSGVTLYDLLASGVPTVAVAFDRIQLRTADAFHERGAVLSAGLLERLSPGALLRCCMELLENGPLVQRITDLGQMLVDGKGLSRVVEIVRRELWLTTQMKTFIAC